MKEHDKNATSPWWREPVAFVWAAGIVMGLSLGIRHAFGIFLLPVITEYGWSRETFSFAIALQNLVWGIAQPLVGMVADRMGARRVILAGLVCYGGGLLGMANCTSPLLFTACTGVLIGVGLACTSFGVIYGVLSRMVATERRGWALGLAGAAGGLGQFFMVPATQSLIDISSWHTTLLILAIACLVLLPLAMPLVEAPATERGQRQSMRCALREAFSHQGFWLLNLGFFACGFQLAFLANHLPSYLRDRGMPPGAAVAGLAIIALANVAGTYCCGILGARFRRKHVLFWLYVLRSLVMGAFFLLPLSPISLYLFCAAIGFIWLGTVPLTNGIIAQIFGLHYLTTLFGFVFFGHQLGSFLGVWLGGIVFDATHSYDAIWQLGIAIGLLSAALHYPIDDAELSSTSTAGTPA